MIEPNYDSLSKSELQALCHERGIHYNNFQTKETIIQNLVDHDWEKSISQLNPE